MLSEVVNWGTPIAILEMRSYRKEDGEGTSTVAVVSIPGCLMANMGKGDRSPKEIIQSWIAVEGSVCSVLIAMDLGDRGN